MMEDFPAGVIPPLDKWSENFCLAGFDPKSGIDIFMHIGRWRKDVSMWRETVAIALPDGRVTTHRAIGNGFASAEGPGGPLLRMRVIEDHKTLRWSFDGAARTLPGAALRHGRPCDGPLDRVAFDLAFHGLSPLWDISKVGHTTDFAGHGHTEQLGRVTGPIRIGDERFAFDGVLNRDHSRGPRVFGQNLRHVWCHGWFPNGIGFQLYEVEIASGTAFSEVAVIDGSQLYEGRLELGFRLPLAGGIAHIHEEVPFKLHYEKGTLDVRAVRFPTTIHGQATTPNEIYLGMEGVVTDGKAGWIEQSVEYLLNQDVTGYGHMERHVPGQWIEES